MDKKEEKRDKKKVKRNKEKKVKKKKKKSPASHTYIFATNSAQNFRGGGEISNISKNILPWLEVNVLARQFDKISHGCYTMGGTRQYIVNRLTFWRSNSPD